MTDTLPSPETVESTASDIAQSTSHQYSDSTVSNVVVVGTSFDSAVAYTNDGNAVANTNDGNTVANTNDGNTVANMNDGDATVDYTDDGDVAIEYTDEGYRGECAGEYGRLAAATSAVEAGTACLHYPEPDLTATGPWLVVIPLGGRLATVHCGAGTVEVLVDSSASSNDATLRSHRHHLDNVLTKARPAHDLYPVSEDTLGVFTTGMTTFTFSGVEVEGELVRISFDVTTTPSTTETSVTDRFEDIDGVREVHFERTAGVERANPSDELRRVAEHATDAIVGDWEYEWYPTPTVFSQIPSENKLALGLGTPGSETFEHEEYVACTNLLSRTISGVSGQ